MSNERRPSEALAVQEIGTIEPPGNDSPPTGRLEIYAWRLKSQARVMTDGEVTTGKKPRRVIGVVAHLERQSRPIGAYKWKVLEEHSVAADIQT